MAKKLTIGLVFLVGIAIIAALMFQVQIGERLFDRAVEQGLLRDVAGDLPDGLHVGLCGSGSPIPDPTRAGPCSVVVAGDKIFVVDAGEGGPRNLARMGLAGDGYEALLLTHFHSDHIDGVGGVMFQNWTGTGASSPLPVLGPAGVEEIVAGFNQAYLTDNGYRVEHHGAETMPPSGAGAVAQPFTFEEGQDELVIYNKGGIKVTSFIVDHDPVRPAVGYRFDYKDRSVVFSGDAAKTPSIAKACNGCDIMVHEALNREMVGKVNAAVTKAGNKRLAKITADIPDYHASPVEAAETAKDGKAKMLVFSHIVPAVPISYLNALWLDGVSDAYDGEVVMGQDGMIFSLPANKTNIEQDELL